MDDQKSQGVSAHNVTDSKLNGDGNNGNNNNGQELVENGEKSTSSQSLNPFQINEIVEVLMKNSPLATVKTCRLVCKLWRTEANRHLFIKGYLTVPVGFYLLPQRERDSSISIIKKFLTPNPNQNQKKNKNKNKIPIRIPNIQLLHILDLTIYDKISSKILGPFVEKLVFSVFDRPDILEQLLKYRLTNLRVLDPHPSFVSDDDLPLVFCTNLLLICARVIKPPRTLTLADLNIFVQCKDDPLCLDKFNTFSYLPNILLEKLSFGFAIYPDDPCFPDIRERMSGMLSRLLERSKDVLTSLRLWGTEMYWAETIVPILPKLEFLYSSIYPPRRRHAIFIPPMYNFPQNFQFSLNMPKLKDTDIFYNYNETTSNGAEDKNIPNFFSSYFDGQKPADSLKMMTYSDYACDFELDPVLKCFSSLEIFNYLNPGDFNKGARPIFTWGKELKTLRLGLVLEALTSKISSFDSILTGFSQKTVDKIKNAPSGQSLKEIMGGDDFTVDSLRIQPSLLDLPNLEVLEIKLIGNALKFLPKKIFTVAGEYAFKLKPKLKVQFYLLMCQPQKYAADALKEVSKLSNVEIIYHG